MRPTSEAVSILLVDDCDENLVAIEAILKSPEYRLVTARSGADALTRILDEDFAVVVLDAFMHDMDGFQVARLIEERERSRDTSFIFLAALGREIQFARREYSAGAVDYLTKPIDAELLRAKVSVLVEPFRRRNEVKRQAEVIRRNERREQELALAKQRLDSEKRYRFLMNVIPQIVWTAHADGAVDYYNERWHQFTGLSVDQLGGAGWLAAVHPDDFIRCRGQWLEAIRTENPYQAECRLRRADGVYRWHLCRALPEYDSGGQIAAWLGTHTDIAEQKRFQVSRIAARAPS